MVKKWTQLLGKKRNLARKGENHQEKDKFKDYQIKDEGNYWLDDQK